MQFLYDDAFNIEFPVEHRSILLEVERILDFYSPVGAVCLEPCRSGVFGAFIGAEGKCNLIHDHNQDELD